MRVLVVGGGSGGHITPAVSVVREILKRRPRTKVEFWTDKKYYANVVKITTETEVHWGDEAKSSSEKRPYIRVRKIAAGKLRRYAGLKLKDYFDDGGKTLFEVTLGNLGGFVGFAGGFLMALKRLFRKKTRPDVIFLKGGFVGLPVGMAAKIYKIPYVIHESDAVPGLANRLLMKRAKVVAMGVPFEKGMKNWEWVGIPVAAEFKKGSAAEQAQLKRALGFDANKPLVMITGGSQGSEHINEAVRQLLPELLEFTAVGLVAGRKHYEEMTDLKKYEVWEKAKLKSDFRMWSFSPAMHELMGAADIVVSRAGATTISELAVLEKATILVPFEKLPGGHQAKNARRLEKAGAAMVLMDEKMVKKPRLLLDKIKTLVQDTTERASLAKKLSEMAKADAAGRLAEILIAVADRKSSKNKGGEKDATR